VGSVGQAPVDVADLRMDNHYTGAQAYYRSKFALAAFTFDLAEELADSGITVNCLHPASLMNTHMVRQSMIPPMSTVANGVRAVMNLATGPAGGTLTGRYFDGRTEARAYRADHGPVRRGDAQHGPVGTARREYDHAMRPPWSTSANIPPSSTSARSSESPTSCTTRA